MKNFIYIFNNGVKFFIIYLYRERIKKVYKNENIQGY